MFDFMRNRGTAGDKQQETLSAYLDNALTPDERTRFEQQLARDPQLRAEVEQLRALRLQLRSLPHRRAPRSFALNPAVYARPKAQPLMQLYPVLRGATALTAFLLIFVLALGVFRGQFAAGGVEAPITTEVAMSETADTAAQEAVPAAAEIEESAPAMEPASEPENAAAGGAAPELEMPPAVTEAPVEAAAEESSQGALAPEGTPVPVPEGDLAVETAAEPTASPEVGMRVEPTTISAPTSEVVPEAMATAVPLPVSNTDDAPRSLLPLQIGLGIAFVLSLALWLIARRSTRL